MPKFRLICSKCKKEVTKLIPKKWDNLPCDCGGILQKQFPTSGTKVVTETTNQITNTRKMEDLDINIKERQGKYFWEVEVIRLVNSGIYSLDTMLSNGWVFYNDKGELETRTSPPKKEAKIKI